MKIINTPGFTAAASLSRSHRNYLCGVNNLAGGGRVVEPAMRPVDFMCGVLGAACVASWLDPVPGDEVICAVWVRACSGLA